jgi:hypothetical protein
MAARDLTGFLDGTRNPDHLLRAIVDQAGNYLNKIVIFPGDNKDDLSHTGGR